MKYFIIILILSTNVFSQNINRSFSGVAINSVDQDAFNAVNSRGSWRPIVNKYNIDGSQLAFSDNNLKLFITTISGKSYVMPNANYNAKSDQIVSAVSKDSVFTFDDSTFRDIKIGNVSLKKFKNKKGLSRFYFILHKSDKITFLKSYYARVKKGTVNALTKVQVTNDKFVIDHKYYLFSNNSVVVFKPKKKSFIKLMSDNKSLIISFIDNNNLDFKNEKDILKLFNYYVNL
jgi:hypothetical protein